MCIGEGEAGRNPRSIEQCKHRCTGMSEGEAGQGEEEGRKGRGEGCELIGGMLEMCVCVTVFL